MDTAHHTLLYTIVYGTHSGWCRWEKSKLARDWELKAFCLFWLVLSEVLVKKAENDSPYCSSCQGRSIWYLLSLSVFLYMYINNWVHIMFKIWYIHLSCIIYCLCCPHDTGFRFWENAVRELELLPGQEFPHRKWRKPCFSPFKCTQQNISQRWSHVRS